MHSPLGDREAQWYLDFAGRVDGPVLELACGTGRLLCRLAKSGCSGVGLELCGAMLSQALQRVNGLDRATRRRVELVQADMRDFHLRRHFHLIVLADNSFRELTATDDQRALLRCVAAHLPPGGTFLLTVRRASPARYQRDIPWSDPVSHPETGAQVQRRISSQLSDNSSRVSGHMIYRTTFPDGRQETVECPFEAPVMSEEVYLDLLGEAGLSARLCVGYEDRHDDGKDPILCFVAEKPADTPAGSPSSVR